MMDGLREQLDVKDDGEWKVLETAIGKVLMHADGNRLRRRRHALRPW